MKKSHILFIFSKKCLSFLTVVYFQKAETEMERPTYGAHEVRDVTDGCAGGCAQVQHLAAGLHVNTVHPSEDSRRQLRAERVPRSVLNLRLSFLKSKCSQSAVLNVTNACCCCSVNVRVGNSSLTRVLRLGINWITEVTHCFLDPNSRFFSPRAPNETISCLFTQGIH